MSMTLELTADQIEILRKVIYPHCVEADVEAALSRYPGALGPADCFPKPFTLDTLTASCVTALSLEKDYFARSFILRLIEQKWDAEPVRRGAVEAVPMLVRPPRGFAAQIAALISALDLLTSRIPATPSIGGIGDVTVFRRFCDARDAVEAMIASLERFETLKAAHDGLHMLQVLGAGWLDAFAGQKADDASATALLSLLLRVKTVTAVDVADLPTAIIESFARCTAACDDAERRIRTEDSDEIAFACATLRAILIREPPLIDATMFAVSRDFPLRQLCSLFPSDPDPTARDAAIDLADTLRRRLMEHALWQSTDLRIYALEQMLAQPSATLLDSLISTLPGVVRDLHILLDPVVAERDIPAMYYAMLRHIMAIDERAPAPVPPPTEKIEGIRTAFGNLRRCARSAFLDVDQTLRLDFTRLLALKMPLQTILDRVPAHCALMVPI